MSAPNPRRLVIRGLARLERTPGATGQAILRTLLDGPDARTLEPRDRAFVTECFYGVLRWRLQLDAIIARLARRGVPDDPELANLLRLGLYQMLHMRVPSRAAVHATVGLARRLRGDKVGGFVNGLLRQVARAPYEPVSLAEKYGHPEWMVDRFREVLGDDAAVEARLAANMTAPPTTLRLRQGEPGLDGATPSMMTPGVVRVDGETEAVRQGIRDGRWIPQDEASARVVHLLELRPGDRVLELCAGRGVKSSQIAELIGPTGQLVSIDTSAAKLAEAARLVHRFAPGVTHHALAADASAALPLRPDLRFDRILVDAPCSGLGVIRRRPETLWRRQPSDIQELAALQRAILAQAEGRLAPGGALVYAVCTTTAEETRDVLGERAVETAFTTQPERDDADGFFAARLRGR